MKKTIFYFFGNCCPLPYLQLHNAWVTATPWSRRLPQGVAVTFFVYFLGIMAVYADSSNLKSIDFRQEDEASLLEITFDKNNMQSKRHHVFDDKQIILDIKNVNATEKVLRDFDTSEFLGSVVYVSAYKNPKNKNDVRIALQLRENVRSNLIQEKNKIILKVENRFGVFNEDGDNLSKLYAYPEEKSEKGEKLHIPKSDSLEDILHNLTFSGKKKYVGKKITLKVNNVTVVDILRMIAEISGFNVITSATVPRGATLSINLVNAPWDQVLDIVLRLNKLVAKKNGTILMIQTMAEATKEAREELENKKLALGLEPLITKIFPVSYAKIGDLQKIIKDYLTPKRGSAALDQRTNSVIVKDTEEKLERVRKIIETLDTQTPQVLIESKIVEFIQSHVKELGLRSGVNFGYDPIGVPGDSERAIVGEGGSAGGEGIDGGPGFAFSTMAGTGDNIIGLTIGRLGRLFNLNFQLQLFESESKAKIISNPKVVTQNNSKASFNTTEDDYYAVTTQDPEGGPATRTFAQQQATVSLDVTPQITNEGSIVLQISLKRDDFADRVIVGGPRRILSNTINTNVLVDDGSTIVLGGIFVKRSQNATAGIPILKDIPFLGWLFKSAYNPTSSKRELMIFLTPKILNERTKGIKKI